MNKGALCIGHPLLTNKNLYTGGKEDDLICLLPGSRKSEIEHHLPVMIKSFKLFSENTKFKALNFVFSENNLKLFIITGKWCSISDFLLPGKRHIKSSSLPPV